MGKKKDYYEILGVPKAATAGDINEAYHKQSALKWKEAERGFERLTMAYKVLSDPLRRPFYDMHLRAEEKLMGKVRPPAASSRGSTGVARGTEVGTGRTSREVAGTGGRKNTDRTGRSAKRAGLGSSTGKAGGENGKRPRGPTDGTTCATGAGLGGATGARASTAFFPTGHSTFETAVKYTNEYYDEEVNCASEDDGEPFCPTDHSTFKTAVKTMNEYYDEDENLGLCMYEDGDKEEGMQDDYGDHAGAGNDDTGVCDDLFNGDDEEGGTQYAKDDDGGGGDHNYGDHAGAGNNDDTGVCDDRFNDDDHYDDAAGGFDDGYYDGDGGDGADDWW